MYVYVFVYNIYIYIYIYVYTYMCVYVCYVIHTYILCTCKVVIQRTGFCLRSGATAPARCQRHTE